MKSVMCTLVITTFSFVPRCNGQIRDSICIHTLGYDSWQQIRQIDSVDYLKYKLDTLYFKKTLIDNKLYVQCKTLFCLESTVFLGEYTSHNSIHFIDSIQDLRPTVRIEGFCSRKINKNELTRIRRVTLGRNSSDTTELCEYNLTIPISGTYITTKLTQSEIPNYLRNIIINLSPPSTIWLSDVSVFYRGSLRTLPLLGYVIVD